MESTNSSNGSSMDEKPSTSKSNNTTFNYVEEPIDDDVYECKPTSYNKKDTESKLTDENNALDQMFSMMGMNGTDKGNMNLEDMMEKITKQFENMPDIEGMKDDLISNSLDIDKEHVYKPIKFATEKFPVFLRENSSKLTKDELKKYTEQFRLLNLICLEFEKNNSESLSSEKKSNVKEMLVKLNTLGELPIETIREDNVLQDLDAQLERMFKNLGEADIGFNGSPSDDKQNCSSNDNQNDADSNLLQPMMQGFLEQMLSKSMMYPSLKHITSRFPEWLRDNLPKLSLEDKKKYTEQFKILTLICLEYEKYTDEQELRKESVEKISRLLESVNELGECPKQISPDGICMDSFGKMSAGSKLQCCVM